MTESQYIAAMKSANAALERQDKQIVELRKERDEMGDKLAMASLLCKPESLEVHNLEQQELGVYNLRASTGFWDLSTCRLRTHARSYEKHLRDKAKALKDNNS
jgi:hypothetical protein